MTPLVSSGNARANRLHRHWRNRRKFFDFRTVNDAIDAAVSTADHVDAATVRRLITERAAIDRSGNSKTAIIDARVTASDANLATERSEHMAADTAGAAQRSTEIQTEIGEAAATELA